MEPKNPMMMNLMQNKNISHQNVEIKGSSGVANDKKKS
jgi:hypothetical protein